jgi:hypothetical protein
LSDSDAEAIHGTAGRAASGSTAGIISGSGSITPSATAKAREALCAAMCFSMSVAACIGFSQILLMLIECPQFLQIMDVPPAMVLVLMYMPQDYASIVGRAEGIGPATTDFRCAAASCCSGVPLWSLRKLQQFVVQFKLRTHVFGLCPVVPNLEIQKNWLT